MSRHLFKCPYGHFEKISDAAARGEVLIDCSGGDLIPVDDECQFEGRIDDHELAHVVMEDFA